MHYWHSYLYILPDIVFIVGLIFLLTFGVAFYVSPISIRKKKTMGIEYSFYSGWQLFLFFFLFLHVVTLFLFYLCFCEASPDLVCFYYNESIVVTFNVLVEKTVILFFSFLYFSFLLCVRTDALFIKIDHFFLVGLLVWGGFILLSCNNFLIFFLALELVSLPCYILIASDLKNNYATEGGLKYLIVGALSTSFILFGLSFIYGATGTVAFSDLFFLFDNAWSTSEQLFAGLFYDFDFFIFFGVFFVVIGLCLKIGIAPFHYWLPEVYNGAPNIITLLFMTVQKFIFWCFFFELVRVKLPSIFFTFYTPLFGCLVICGFVLGIFPALFQYKLKKLIIYSSVAINSFLLVAILAGDFTSFFLFLSLYILNTFGVFAFIFSIKTVDGFFINNIALLRGFFAAAPLISLFFSFLFLSFIGLPPAFGFITKFFVYYTAFRDFWFLTIFGIICSIFMSFYYFQVIRFLFFYDNKAAYPLAFSVFFRYKNYFLIFLMIALAFFNFIFFLFYEDIYLYFYELNRLPIPLSVPIFVNGN